MKNYFNENEVEQSNMQFKAQDSMPRDSSFNKPNEDDFQDDELDVPSPTVTAREELSQVLKEYFGDDFDLDDEESLQVLISYIRNNKTRNNKLLQTMEKDPRLAQFFSDILQGKRNAHSSLARYFGRDYFNIDENSEEFEEMMRADEERRNEAYELSKERRVYENNLRKSRPVIEQFCSEKGYEPSEFMDMVWQQLAFPILSGDYSPQVCKALENALFYEKDIEDAFAAGDIKGRNTNIQRMKEDYSDGMPKGISSSPVEMYNKKPKRNNLIESALNA